MLPHKIGVANGSAVVALARSLLTLRRLTHRAWPHDAVSLAPYPNKPCARPLSLTIPRAAKSPRLAHNLHITCSETPQRMRFRLASCSDHRPSTHQPPDSSSVLVQFGDGQKRTRSGLETLGRHHGDRLGEPIGDRRRRRQGGKREAKRRQKKIPHLSPKLLEDRCGTRLSR